MLLIYVEEYCLNLYWINQEYFFLMQRGKLGALYNCSSEIIAEVGSVCWGVTEGKF